MTMTRRLCILAFLCAQAASAAAICEIIPYDREYRRLTMKAAVLDKRGQKRRFDAAIDTGAAVTLIPQSAVAELKYDFLGRATLGLADGADVEAEIARVYGLSFRGVLLRGPTVAILPLGEDDHALIGMPELARLHWSFGDGQFKLCDKKPKR
jgi:predicted aspartyl protease